MNEDRPFLLYPAVGGELCFQHFETFPKCHHVPKPLDLLSTTRSCMINTNSDVSLS